MKKIIFLVSGSGTNMENLIMQMKEGKIPAEPVLVISNKPEIGALDRAALLRVPACVIDHKQFKMREEFDRELARVIDSTPFDYVCLAGFMRLLTPWFVRKYPKKLINIHPSYLPEFPGAHAIRDAYVAKVRETGVTVHFVDEGTDTGPIILQEKVPIHIGENIEAVEARVHDLEYKIYPEALRLVLKGEKS